MANADNIRIPATFDATIFRAGRENKPSHHINFSWAELINELSGIGSSVTSPVIRVVINRNGKDNEAVGWDITPAEEWYPSPRSQPEATR